MRQLASLSARSATLIAAILMSLVCTASLAQSAGCCDPASPFREGEELAATPATCENIADWAEKAPKTSARVTLSIVGKLSKVEASAALVYLTMCDESRVKVICVTYETNDMKAGDKVSFAGGYERSTAGDVVLDPCLASPE